MPAARKAVPLNFSPYFEVVKPSLASGFDYKRLVWEKTEPRGKTGQS